MSMGTGRDCGHMWAGDGGVNGLACLLEEGHDGPHAAPWAEATWTDAESFNEKWTDRPVTGDADAREFLADAVEVLGGGFHPDTRFGDYVTNGVATFRHPGYLEDRIVEVFRYLEVDVYQVTLDLLHAAS